MSSSAAAQLRRVSLPEKAGLKVANSPLAPSGEWSPLVWLVGAHGGAGTSTLARVLGPFGDAGQTWPAEDEHRWCVVVARSTRSGVEAAHDAVLQAQAGKVGHCCVWGVILVEDAPGKTPKSIEQRISVLEKIVPTIWRVPYVGEWRENLLDRLPEWSPLDEPQEPESTSRVLRKRTKVSALEQVPQPVRRIGEELVERAYEAHKQTSSN
ncbi:DUF6668 family protein [Corynebacterium mucifaciens]|uniref:Uncharacterized protein n=1 Tax=Corynebacterium mucifaciens TaxID=57171 RepID=A0A7X6RFE5_9CORY|nr:hypothetical protein [Corynebacterium mucifaciens]